MAGLTWRPGRGVLEQAEPSASAFHDHRRRRIRDPKKSSAMRNGWRWTQLAIVCDTRGGPSLQNGISCILCPAAPTVAGAARIPSTACAHERKIVIKGRSLSPADPTFWDCFTTMAYLPSTVAPAGLAKSGLPARRPDQSALNLAT